MVPPDSFDAFKTDLKLAILTLKDEVRYEVSEASKGVLTEVRERLQRAEEERSAFYKEASKRLETIEDLARATNGRVNKHEYALYGDDRDGDGGALKEIKVNSNWRKALVAAGGAWLCFLWALWMIWGPDVQARGVLNRPEKDYQEFVDERIKQYFPEAPKPAATPPPLDRKKKE